MRQFSLCFAVITLWLTQTCVAQNVNITAVNQTSRKNCTIFGHTHFPPDVFTERQREQGAILLHFFMAFYCFTMLGFICNDYFLPSVDCICTDLNLSQDVAGATFMAMATSVPELFVNVIGTFITESDLGVGAVVGSSVFNTLGVAACTGIAVVESVPLNWWPLTRDCSIYTVVLATLTVVVWDGQVQWYEATVLILLYIVYFVLMYANNRLHHAAKTVGKWLCKSQKEMQRDIEHLDVMVGTYRPHAGSVLRAKLSSTQVEYQLEKPNNGYGTPFSVPPGGIAVKLWWVYKWPIVFLLFITIPDCRKKKLRRLYPFTFLMCVVWIGAASYMVAWMITLIGETFEIPDSVMGLTLLAAGACLPETIASVIMARQGEGSMGISNSLGANTLDVLLCLGLPWLVKTLINGSSIQLISSGLGYNCLALNGLVFIFFIVVVLFNFKLDCKLGVTCLTLYIVYILFAVLIEFNIFFYVNPSVC